VVLADVLVHAIDAALQDREEALNDVCVRVAPDILVSRMDYRAMAGKLLADSPVDTAFIRAEMRIGRERFSDNRLQGCGGYVRNMEGRHAPTALPKRQVVPARFSREDASHGPEQRGRCNGG
jgi:hypothetical protein